MLEGSTALVKISALSLLYMTERWEKIGEVALEGKWLGNGALEVLFAKGVQMECLA